MIRPLGVVFLIFMTLGSASAQQRAPGAVARPLSPRNANYTIDVMLDARTHTLNGSETLVWTNIANAPTQELRFHLYYNAWRNDDTTYMKETRVGHPWGDIPDVDAGARGSIDVNTMKIAAGALPPTDLTSALRFISPDDENSADRTVLAVTLPAPVAPGQSLTLNITWRSAVPHAVDRTGFTGNYYFFGQWFPKIGVLQDGGVWNCHQFHATTEFFSDFGVYDVRMTVPRGWALAATGEQRDRSDTAAGATTYHYYQEDVHDFAWTTSPDFVERHEIFDEAGLPPVDLRLMMRPEHLKQIDRHVDAARAALKYYGQWIGPYPYGHLTVVDPAWQSESGGMEYPTLFTAGTTWLQRYDEFDPYDVVIHEAGHQWFYGVVASNEFEDAWMDEGLNTYVNVRVDTEAFGSRMHYTRRYFGGLVPWVFKDIDWDRVVFGDYVQGYRSNPTVDTPSTPSFRYWPGSPTPMTYSKTSLWMHTLERALGWPAVQRVLATYFERWQFRHPKPDDFFQVANEVTGKDLSPFFDQVYRGSATFDYAVEHVDSSAAGKDNYRTDVIVRRRGDGIFPVTVLVTFRDGGQTRVAWDGVSRWKAIALDHPTDAVSAQVDPDQVLLLDTNFTNNSYSVEPNGRAAAAKWAAKWMVWLQDQLLTWALFV